MSDSRRKPRRKELLSRTAAALVALVFGACSCNQEPPPLPEAEGETLRLLARQPDGRIEQPGVIVPQGDVPGSISWGPYDGPGWSAKDHVLADGTHYRETNQPVAKLVLPATKPQARELVLRLWRARQAGSVPTPVRVLLNGAELHADLELASEPGEVKLEAPEPFWTAGENQLELELAPQLVDGARVWDTLALASASYGPPAIVALDLAAATARLPAETGVRYAIELRDDAVLRCRGRASGPGTLRLRSGSLERVRGAQTWESAPLHEVDAREGPLELAVALPQRAAGPRLLEVLWSSTTGAELALDALDAVEQHVSPSRPPIVLVSIDTFAARHLSLHGYGRKTSPVLEALQREAVVFERAQTNAPWTMPSYLALMSGLYPRAHLVGVAEQAGAEIDNYDRWQIADSRWTLAEALRSRGYRTAAFIDTFWLSPLFGFDQGFDHFDGQAALAPFTDVHAGIELIVKQLVPPWLAAGPEGVPPFLFFHALDAHGPYLPEEPFRDAFAASLPADRRETPAGSINQTYRAIPDWMARTEVPDEAVPVPSELPLETIVERYDETLLKVDAYLGQLVELLKSRGLWDGCVLVVTGDHGETFGPDVYGHGVLREPVLHVPLLLKLPRGEHAGQRVKTPVQLVDLYPTLLELAGVVVHEGHLHGESLLRRLEEGTPSTRAQYTESGWVEQYSLTDGRWKLVEERPGSESAEQSLLTHPRVPESWLRANFPEVLERPLSNALLRELMARPDYAARIAELRQVVAGPYFALYDLETDPAEQRDRSADEPEVFARLRERLDVERKRSLQAQGDANPDVHRQALSAEALEELKKLGY